MVRFLISTEFWGASHITGRRFFDLSSNDVARIRRRLLFDAQRLLEEIRYFYSQV